MVRLFQAAKMKLGDRSAFDVLYEKYSTRIIRSAYLLTGDYQRSEDTERCPFFIKRMQYIVDILQYKR